MPEETLAVMYRLAGVFVFPSLYEGFGLPPLEAMASGTPVVTSNVSSLPEVAGDAAVLVDPYQPRGDRRRHQRVLTDETLRRELRRKGLARAKQFSWEQSVAPRARHLPVEVRRALKLALVHDWLTGMRGGEKVLEVLCERFPDAELFTLLHVRGSVSPTIERLPIHTSFIQRLPAVHRYYRACLPLFPTAIEQFDFDRFDLVLSISHCVAKSIVHRGSAPHLCYCLTPMRYAWDQFDAYFGPERLGGAGSRLMRTVMGRMARWDRDTADRADRYVAISHYVAGRIGRYYNREATVVYPPVDTELLSTRCRKRRSDSRSSSPRSFPTNASTSRSRRAGSRASR